MIPVFEAIDIIAKMPATVGHTQPWIVIAENGISYVVKLYTQHQVDVKNAVENEVIGNALAADFSLSVPQCAFINISEELVATKPSDFQLQFNKADIRTKFATVALDGVNTASASLKKSNFTQRLPIDTLFAFDNLIKNADRGQGKPNLLLSTKGKQAYLIDHEYVLDRDEISNTNWSNFSINPKFTQHHLCFNYLKHSQKKFKQTYFDEFLEYLRYMNVGKLNPYFKDLHNQGFITSNQVITNWLAEVKQNSTNFVNHLRGIL